VRRRAAALLAGCCLVLCASGPAVAASGLDGELRRAERRLAGLQRQVAPMRRTAERFAHWQTCIAEIPVSEHGDPDGGSGYVYDPGDGTGSEFLPALAVDRRHRRTADYHLFALRSRAGCASAPSLPGGTADAATAGGGSPRVRVARLARRVARLDRTLRRLTRTASRFDVWESCTSQLPVTSHGDPGGAFGYRSGNGDPTTWNYRSALSIDRSDWDDPDYMLLAFVGRDRPGRECDRDPGEGVD
jgi:hypothetical protein